MTGWVEAKLVYVSAPVGGVLTALAAQEGAQVQKGDLLFSLDDLQERLQRLASEAKLAQANAQLQNLQTGRRSVELRVVREQLAQAVAALGLSEANLARGRALVRQEFLSQAGLEALDAAAKRDAARVEELKAQLQSASLAARPDEIEAARAQARYEQANSSLSRWRESQVVQSSPTDAVVVEVLYRKGERVPAERPVVSLLPVPAANSYRIRFFVPEPELARVAVGTPVNITCDACKPGLRAKVTYIAPQAEFTPPVIYSRDTRAKLVFLAEATPDPESAALLRQGQPVDVLPAAVGEGDR